MLARWRERDVFHESQRRRAGAPRYVFYEGPPTANGRPGSHHVLSRVFKDIFPRYQTMRGKLVERRGGWDCHGLPVELAVEQQLGISSKHEIEAYGIAEFNERCRASVFEYLEDWHALTERIGFWVDLDRAYRTLDPTYIESVWWALKTDRRQGPPLRGLQGRPVLPALRHGAVEPRGRARLQGRRRPVAVRAHAGGRGRRAGPARRRAARLDHDAVDPRRQRGDRRRSRAHLRAREDGPPRGAGRARRGARRARARRGRAGARPLPGRRAGRRALRAAVPVPRPAASGASAGTPCCWRTSSPPTTAPVSCTRRSRSARTTSGSASATG